MSPVSNESMSNHNSSSELNGMKSGRKRKYACVECRQQKSKCNYDETNPDPCSRCAKKGIHCVIKKDFRRLSKRARAEAIERQVSHLTSHLFHERGGVNLNELYDTYRNPANNSMSPTHLNLLNNLPISKFDHPLFSREQLDILKLEASNPNSTSTTPITPQFNEIQSPRTSRLPSEKLECTPKTLGDVHMTSAEISDLFQEYATKYHQFLPIVDLTRGAESIYNLSPSLFWVIILTGLRHKQGSLDLMTKLSTLVKSVLAEITISPIIRYTPTETDEPLLNVASVYSVQAFLIYTFWPPLTSSLSADTSWNTIGTAMFQAIRVGLNSADFSKEYATMNPELTKEQVKTWISCNIVSQIVASSFGFPAYVSFDDRMVNPTNNNTKINQDSELLPELKQMSQIVHFENQVQATLHANPGNRLGLVEIQEKIPLIMVLGQQLDQLETSLNEDTERDGSSIDNIRKFQLLLARVHLLTYYFIGDTTEEITFESKRGLVKVYNAAIALLEHTRFMCSHDPTIIKYFPGVFVLNIWQSACIISKLVHSSLNGILDVERGRIAYQHAIQLTSNASIIEYDTAYRFSGIMKSIWNMFNNLFEKTRKKKEGQQSLSSNFNLSVTVKSRMSASVFFDCLYILKEKCGVAKLERERENSEGSGKNSDNVEDDARLIIKTIPLDPSPINAGSSTSKKSSRLNSPNNNHEVSTPSSILSLEKILNKVPPDESRKSPAELKRLSIIRSGSVPPTMNASPPVLSSSQSERKETPKSNNSNELLGDAWDTWGSDVNLKDLDLLLNDFAFNPTL